VKGQDDLKVAIVQFRSGDSVNDNLSYIQTKIKAIAKDADLIIFPEYSMKQPVFQDREAMIKSSENIDGMFISNIRQSARDNAVNVLMNFIERNGNTEKPFNTSILINSMGMISGKYQKIHLFDSYGMKESAVYTEGHMKPELFSVKGYKLGMEICYDIRFPELTRLYSLNGAHIVTVQAGFFEGDFKLETWTALLQSLAMCNGTYILASGQGQPGFIGHSMVIHPSGKILAEAGNGDEVLLATIHIKECMEYLETVPVLEARRRDIYDVHGL
jgi:Predicted amidohydrolase